MPSLATLDLKSKDKINKSVMVISLNSISNNEIIMKNANENDCISHHSIHQEINQRTNEGIPRK